MKPLLAFAVALPFLLGASPARADGDISVTAGILSMNLGKSASGGSATVSGKAYGARVLRSLSPAAAIGVGADFLKPADTGSDKLIVNARSRTSIDSATFLGLLRVGPTEAALQPHALIGLGVHVTSFRLEAQPQPGFGWIDTMTSEKRTLVDSQGMGLAIKLEGGADYALDDHFLVGAYASFTYLGGAQYEATDQAKSLGVGALRGSMTALSAGVSLTGRF